MCVVPMSEASDTRELTVLVFMTRSLAGTVAATKASGPLYALIHVSAPNERSVRKVGGTSCVGCRSLQCVNVQGLARITNPFAHMECM